MLYQFDDFRTGVFIERPNRYIAKVDVEGRIETVHVHDPGRLKELLYSGNTCLVRYAASEKRKTDWDMIAAQKEGRYVLVHSGYHRYIAEAVLSHPAYTPFERVYPYRAEVTAGESRLDFCLVEDMTLSPDEPLALKKLPKDGRRIWVEVKGCSLSIDGVAKFPDAPTTRGRRHLETLMTLRARGERAAVLILVLSDAVSFVPNRETDPEFYEAFYRALDQGVEIYPVQVKLDLKSKQIVYVGPVPIQELAP